MWPQHDRAAEGDNMTQPCCQRHGRVVCTCKAKMNCGDLTGAADDRCNLRPGMVQHWPTVHRYAKTASVCHTCPLQAYCTALINTAIVFRLPRFSIEQLREFALLFDSFVVAGCAGRSMPWVFHCFTQDSQRATHNRSFMVSAWFRISIALAAVPAMCETGLRTGACDL